MVFYGAGEVMALAWPVAQAMGFDVVGVVDDDAALQGQERNGLVVRGPEASAGVGAFPEATGASRRRRPCSAWTLEALKRETTALKRMPIHGIIRGQGATAGSEREDAGGGTSW